MNGLLDRWHMRVLAGSLAVFGAAVPAWAEPAPPFSQLLLQTVDAPRLEVLDAEVDRAEGLSEQARVRPNPVVSLYTENVAGSSPYSGLNGAETTLQYSQPFELKGKRSSRIAAGRAAVRAAQARSVEGRIAYAYDLARAYAAADVAERRIALVEDEIEEATADLRVARALVGAGKEARLKELQAETALNAVESDLEVARANRVAALARLSALAGVDTPYTGISESLLNRLGLRSIVGPVDPLVSAAYLAAQAEREAAALRVTAEARRTVPDITGQVGVRRLELNDATALIAGVSVPLRLFDRNRGNIAAAEAELRAADARVAVARLEAQAIAQSAAALIAAADARAGAAERTMTTAEETYRLARIAYEAGKSPLIELLAARRGLGQARGVILDAAIARLDARANLARLQGVTIIGEPVQ